jgi:GT2 family glycosyltransferase
MALHVGIGLITYNRKGVLRDTLELLRRNTVHPNTSLVVADDGSTDGTRDMLDGLGVAYVTGDNGGVAWNKNRALFVLEEIAHSDVVILLEDDTAPTAYGWDTPWIKAAVRYGHMNVALEETNEHYLGGSGTVADPIISTLITAQCACFSREALRFAGYFDPRFKGYGHEHVEHSIRMVRCGYGGHEQMVQGRMKMVFKLLRSEFTLRPVKSFGSQEASDRNLALTQRIVVEQHYRAPWQDEAEMVRFRAEMRDAHARHPGGFPLQPEGYIIPPSEGRAPWFGMQLPP